MQCQPRIDDEGTDVSEGRVLVSHDDETGVARITIDNPQRGNSYSPVLRREMRAYLDELADDGDVKVVHLRGAGGVFSAGSDMKQRLRVVRRRCEERSEFNFVKTRVEHGTKQAFAMSGAHVDLPEPT